MSRCAVPILAFLAVLLVPGVPNSAEEKKPDLPKLVTGKALTPMVTGLKNPESVVIGLDGRIYVTEIGEFGKDGDGRVSVIVGGKAVPFATGLDDPKGLVSFGGALFTADNKRVMRIDKNGKVTVFAPEKAFPNPPLFLNDVEVDAKGVLYVSDSGDLKGKGGAVYRINQKGKVTTLTDATRNPALKVPNGLQLDGEYFLHLLDAGSGELHRVALKDGKTTKVAEGVAGGDGIARDHYGRLYLSSWGTGKVFVIPRPGEKPRLLASGFQSAADLCLAPDGKHLLVPDMKAGTITAVPAIVPGEPVDESPLPVKTALAFPKLTWTGWKGETDKGLIVPHRPVILTHSGDGSNRVFVGTQQGVLHVFPNDQKATKTKIFLDVQDRVRYDDKTNEEGFLGLAFPPNYKKSGEFYVYYTLKKDKLVNVVSRFRVSRDDPDKADPASEEVLMRIPKPFWNHDGGTLCFGPDGYLYVAVGDGGLANDPFNNGQKLSTLLGKVLRIDVSLRGGWLPYGIPKDNPFLKTKGARPEVWAYGLRNIWRMSFDRKTGKLWAADVGQNLWEEINLIERGGNYGWKLREGQHPFSDKGVGPRKDLIEPIWEYHHDIGKSITGGHVYRGSRLPVLDGLYLYADYVSGTMWALRYDDKKKRVTANHVLRPTGFPVYSFGEDERGEVYFLTSTTTGEGIHWFVPAKAGKR